MRLSARRAQPSLTIVPKPSRRGAMSSPLQAAKGAQRRRPVKIPGNEGLGPPRGEWARGALLTKRRVGDQAVEGPGRGQIQRVKHQCAQRTDRQIGRELRLKAPPGLSTIHGSTAPLSVGWLSVESRPPGELRSAGRATASLHQTITCGTPDTCRLPTLGLPLQPRLQRTLRQ